MKKSQATVLSTVEIQYKDKNNNLYLCGPGQALPVFDTLKGSSDKSIKAVVYTALMTRNYFWTTISGECLTKEEILSGRYGDPILGYGFGMRILDFKHSVYGMHTDPGVNGNPPSVQYRHLSVSDFCRIHEHSLPALCRHDTGMPCYYYAVPESEPASSLDVTLWTPDRGVTRLRKAPIPFIITGVGDLISEYGINANKQDDVLCILINAASRWMAKHNINTLYLGYESTDPGEDHLLSVQEFEEKYTYKMRSTPYSLTNAWKHIDVNRPLLITALRNRSFDTEEASRRFRD